MDDLSPQETDGRRRRSADSRARIVAAMLELTRESALVPGAEQVALRAGVGLRTVFRHFQDMDSLYSEIAGPFEAALRGFAHTNYKSMVDGINAQPKFSKENEAAMKKCVEDFLATGTY